MPQWSRTPIRPGVFEDIDNMEDGSALTAGSTISNGPEMVMQTVLNTILWHQRLRHIHRKRLLNNLGNNMVKLRWTRVRLLLVYRGQESSPGPSQDLQSQGQVPCAAGLHRPDGTANAVRTRGLNVRHPDRRRAQSGRRRSCRSPPTTLSGRLTTLKSKRV